MPDTSQRFYQNSFTRFFFYLVNSPIFNGTIMFIIVINTVLLAMDKYPAWDKGT